MAIKRNVKRSGQGLVEYAIIIGLVAVVCVIILGLFGLAATRNYGIVAGALGAKKEIDTETHYIRFQSDTNFPQCGISHGQLYFRTHFFSDISDPNEIKELTVATDNGLIPTIDPIPSPPPGIGNYEIRMFLAPGATCPRSLVIQTPKSMGGQTFAYTVLQQDFFD